MRPLVWLVLAVVTMSPTAAVAQSRLTARDVV